MWQAFIRFVVLGGGVLMLAACGFADSRSPLPGFMRAKEADPPPPETPPNVKQLVRDKLDFIFVAASAPREVQVSQPHHEPRGQNWTACVRAEVNSATGKPMGVQTYRITISGGMIIDRQRVEEDDNCASETYEPI
jgi:hypothetical protein